jgi:ketosteroid isomerase-like protein
MKARHGLVGLAAMSLLAGCQKAPKFTADDETAVRATFDVAAKSVKSGAYDTWAATFAEDGVFQPANGKAVTGRPALVAWAKAMPAPMEMFSFSGEKISGDGVLAYGTSNYAMKMTGFPADTGKQLVVFKKGDDGKWLIEAISFNSDLPLPPPPAAKPAAAAKAPPRKAPAKKPPAKAPIKKGP